MTRLAPRWRMRMPSLALLAVSMALVGAAGETTNIHYGFKHDGETTYCQGVFQDEGPLVFEELLASSAGKCPLHVHLSLSSVTLPTIDTQLTVNWTAALIPGDLATTLFPRVVNETSRLPKDVIASLLRACKAGSDCAAESDVVVPAGLGSDETAVGGFESDGKKKMRSYVFQFPATGEYVVIGKVVLPGDAQLNVSATEFVTFQRVMVGDVPSASEQDEVAAGTAKPAGNANAIANDVAGTTSFTNTTPSPPTTAAETEESKSNLAVDAQDAADAGPSSSSTSSTSSGGGNTTYVIVLSSIAAIGAVIALVYFVTTRKRRQNPQNPSSCIHTTNDDNDRHEIHDTPIYRLTGAAKNFSSPTMPLQRSNSRPPTRLTMQSQRQQQQLPQRKQATATYSSSRTIEQQQQQQQPPPLSRRDLDSLDSQPTVMRASVATSFGDLHDSAIGMPTLPRTQRASSASSFRDTLDDGDDDLHRETRSDAPSGFTEATISAIISSQRRQHQVTAERSTVLSAYHDTYGFEDSMASWAYSERASEVSHNSMSDLTTVGGQAVVLK